MLNGYQHGRANVIELISEQPIFDIFTSDLGGLSKEKVILKTFPVKSHY